MNIERIEGNTQTVYLFHVDIDHSGVVTVRPSGAQINTRPSIRSQWKPATYITWENHSERYRAYDSIGRCGAPGNHRDYNLIIPDDIKAEALASITVIWQDNEPTLNVRQLGRTPPSA
jgi:hypothetical protein